MSFWNKIYRNSIDLKKELAHHVPTVRKLLYVFLKDNESLIR